MDELDPVRRLRPDPPEPTDDTLAAGRARLAEAIVRRSRRRRRGRLVVVGVVTAAVAASCLASVTIGPRDAGPGLVEPAHAALTPFEDCAGVRDWYVDAALPHVTAWGLEGASGPPVNVLESRRDGFQLDTRGNGPTGTNVQESGVDEPDVAKTNGEHVITLDGADLVVSDVTGTRPRELGRVHVPGARGGRLLLVGERAVVVSGRHGGYFAPVMLDYDRSVGPTRTRLSTVDLSEPAEPVVEHTRRIDGSLVAARAHDGVVRVAMSSSPSLPFVTPNPNVSPARARAENRRIVRDSTISDWLPASTVDGRPSPLVDCSQVSHPSQAAGVGTITVLTVDPADPAAAAATAVTADGSLVYASTDRFYVATTEGGWLWPGRREDETTTDIHAFGVDGSSTPYVASGTIDGHVPDRWAFSEYDDVLRVAAEQGNGWAPRETVVSMLQEHGDTLRVVGSVGGMGEGEQIKAVRWFGDIGVVVTFRQTDPLYTLDLSEPADPRVAGELKIRGYSAYLHPVGADRLIGVGQAANGRGFERGLQVSAFDLADLARPVRTARLTLGRRWSRSPVGHESRAFTYLPAHRLMFVPARGGGEGSRVEIVRVSDAGELRAVETIGTPRWDRGIRALPLGGDRVAVVAGGSVVRVADVAAFG